MKTTTLLFILSTTFFLSSCLGQKTTVLPEKAPETITPSITDTSSPRGADRVGPAQAEPTLTNDGIPHSGASFSATITGTVAPASPIQ